MKRTLAFSLLVVGFSLYACSGNKQAEEGQSYKGYVSNAERTPTTMDGKPVAAEPKATAPAAAADSAGGEAGGAGAIDVNAPSDSKGVGTFTDVAIADGLDADMAARGQEVFQTSCTACHTPTAQKLIGPGLKGITKIRTPEWILNMITDPVKMTKNDPIAKALLAESNNIQMTDQNVSDEDARAILEFLRQNDGVK